MTENEIVSLCLGFTMGAQLMLAVQLIGGRLDDRRDRRAAEASLAQAQKRSATSDWRAVLAVRERA